MNDHPHSLGMPPSDKRAYKWTLGTFPTGVTIVTGRDPGGVIAGLTVNSFNSLSLDPPLVMWAIGDHPHSRPVFETTPVFAVNFLSVDQPELAQRFAEKHQDRFATVAWQSGIEGVPLLADCAAWLECRIVSREPHGDHLLIVGRVERHAVSDREPLTYFRGKYHRVGATL